MDIEDLLNQLAPDFSRYLYFEMKRVAGDSLYKSIVGMYEGKREPARDWFYSRNIALGGVRPYDYCKLGRQDEVQALVGRIEHGVF